ncbi:MULTISPECIES: nitronate monooxygenase family protein [unclassified Bradyrhizobium]|jgi:nitronate monooxygenase|uniref:NAD(P)H-dependent flavin oxidoreductase n=1 Tax=unclassified Bradyrhizobium TaxID=2631580 RepID=UPI0020112CDD|nr:MULTISPECIES: nitronate monooxygenase family protein [unclassified Bradyrhizobium]
MGKRLMWSQNAFTDRLNLKWPILQAPMGSLSTPALAAAVSNAGGLGGLGMWGFSAEEAERRIAGFQQLSGGSLNVNYPLWPEPRITPDVSEPMRTRLQAHFDAKGLGAVPEPKGAAGEVSHEHLSMLMRAKPQMVSFHFGLPDQEVINAIKDAGIFIISSATTVAEARMLEQRGVDAIIAQGTEAGGHRGTFTGVDISMQPGLFALLPQVVDAVRVPVIAAGGVADGRTVAASFVLGASAVQLGTAFLRCEEANVLDAHRAALREPTDACTVVTDVITGRPARYVKNGLIDDLVASELRPVAFPGQLSLTAPLGGTGDRELTALFAGQSAALASDTTAGALVEQLAEATSECLRVFSRS